MVGQLRLLEASDQHGGSLQVKQDVVTVEGDVATSRVRGVLSDQLRVEGVNDLAILPTASQAGHVLHQTPFRPVPADFREFDEADLLARPADDDVLGVEVGAAQCSFSFVD